MNPIGPIKELQAQAQLARKRGDALRAAAGSNRAADAYGNAANKLEECLALLDEMDWQKQKDLAAERAECLGSLGGILRRLGNNEEALERYRAGAKIEREFRINRTYNQVNKVKFSLMLGKTTLTEEIPDIRETVKFLKEFLTSPTEQDLSDGAWAWADLGDCLSLLDDLPEAARAYGAFIAKADIKSPSTTLEVLDNLAIELVRHNDPAAKRVTEAVGNLREMLRLR